MSVGNDVLDGEYVRLKPTQAACPGESTDEVALAVINPTDLCTRMKALSPFDQVPATYMTRATKMKFASALVAAAMLHVTSGLAAGIEGTWTYAKSVERGAPSGAAPQPQFRTFKITGDLATFTPTCAAHLKSVPYSFDAPFQAFLGDGVSEAAVDAFLKKSLDFTLAGTKNYYDVAEDSPCNSMGMSLFSDGTRLVVFDGLSKFYEFTRAGDVGTTAAASSSAILKGYVFTVLPFNVEQSLQHCAPPLKHGVPVPTNACAPREHVYVASKGDKDALRKLVGEHNYLVGRPDQGGGDYDNPWRHDLHPVFVVLPPLGDVALVRVDDVEHENENRTPFAGAYLAILNGKVVDRLDDSCNFDANYVCSSGPGYPSYRLTSSGKFQPLSK